MSDTNHQIRLAARPTGLPTDENWELTTEPVPDPRPGEVLVQISHISIDPAMRGLDERRAPPTSRRSRSAAVMRAGTVGRVLASEADGLPPATTSTAPSGVQEYAVAPARELTKVDPDLAPLPTYLGRAGPDRARPPTSACSTSGAWPRATPCSSPAPRARWAAWSARSPRIKGARAVGIAGGPEKCRWLTEELGFDAAIDYKARGRARASCAGTRPTGSTCSSTTSAARSSTPA